MQALAGGTCAPCPRPRHGRGRVSASVVTVSTHDLGDEPQKRYV